MSTNSITRMARSFLSWHLKPSDAPNFDVLDGLRGLAVLLVVGSHLVYTNPSSSIYLRYIGSVFGTGGCGVALFFCLSGFLVSLPFWKRKCANKSTVFPRGYVQRRFFKIYPPLALTVLLFTPIYYYSDPDLGYLKAACEWLVGAPLLFPVDGRFNPVMWSIVVEVQFYIALPFIMLLFRNVPMTRSIWQIPLVFIVIGYGFRNLFAIYGVHGTIHPYVYSPLFSGFDMFAAGIFVSGLSSMGWVTKAGAKAGSAALLVLVVLLPLKGYLFVTQLETEASREAADFILQAIFGCLLCLIGDSECLSTRLLCNPLLRWFGIVSYEWYLLHQAVFIWVRSAIGQANGSLLTYLLIVGGSFLASLLLAALIYKYFSLPILMRARSSR